MSLCLSTGQPHAHEACARCARVDQIAAATRADPRVVVQREVADAAWRVRQDGRELPLLDWLKRDAAYQEAQEAARRLFSAVWDEKAEEVDRGQAGG